IPVNSSDAITGHKLQGLTKDSLVMYEWDSDTCWIYDVLSRVITLKGLYLIRPISKSDIKAASKEYLEFMERMETLANLELGDTPILLTATFTDLTQSREAIIIYNNRAKGVKVNLSETTTHIGIYNLALWDAVIRQSMCEVGLHEQKAARSGALGSPKCYKLLNLCNRGDRLTININEPCMAEARLPTWDSMARRARCHISNHAQGDR
ncbi:hypothetical protein THAOC_20196, partial [Thalassiosira oceanica]